MYLQELRSSWFRNPFWRTARLLSSNDEVEQILASGIMECVIDTAKGADLGPEPAMQAEQTASMKDVDIADPPMSVAGARALPASRATSRDEEFARAASICASATRAVMHMFNEARMGAALDAEMAVAVVQEIAESINRNSSALISLARLKNQDDYTYMHSVSVCALMIAVARRLGLSEEVVRQSGFAGLTHDIGKMNVPPEVLNKPGKLTDAEYSVVKHHAHAGHVLLKKSGDVGEIALDVCLHHHEKMDGTGYPHGLAGDQISLYARMGAVCDVYDAITSNRPYKAGWCPAISIKKMASWCPTHFDPTVFHALVTALGIYPVGSLVRLASNRLAVVVDQNEKSLLAPVVRAFFSCTAITYITPVLIDLGAPGNRDKIASLEDAEKWGLSDINRFWT